MLNRIFIAFCLLMPAISFGASVGYIEASKMFGVPLDANYMKMFVTGLISLIAVTAWGGAIILGLVEIKKIKEEKTDSEGSTVKQ